MTLLIKNVILHRRKVDVLVEEGIIKKIGKNLDRKTKEKIDGRGEKAILPGLINCHTHTAMVLFRGLADDLTLKEWLETKIWAKEEKLTADDVYWGTKLAILEMLKTGTTTFNDMYWYPEAQISAVGEMGVRAVIGLAFTDSSLNFKKKIESLYENFKEGLPSTIKLAIAPHALYTVSQENLIWAKKFANRHKLLLHMHVSETEKEVKECKRETKLRPVEYLEKIGFLDKNCIFAHSIWLSPKEIKILKKRRCNLVYNPCSNMKLASGVFPYLKLKKAGLNICLGTDGAASNNSFNLFSEMKFAALLQKVKERNPTIASAQEIFALATQHGARALRINAGKIKEGKIADLILVNLDDISLLPGYNLLSDLVYSFFGRVSDAICNGKIIMRDGKIKGEEEIKKEVKRLIA